mgnify:CR=1 FL=1
MRNCIYNAHCSELTCDKSCPIFVQTSYLLERNNISVDSPIMKNSYERIPKVLKVLDKFEGSVGAIQTKYTVEMSELFTYCAICQHWSGSQLHCNVYRLKFSKYLEDTKQSWGARSENDDLEYTRIWSNSCKVLIISNLDYVNFGDFESQMLLNLIQSRQSSDKTTLLILPPPGQLPDRREKISLIGKGSFYKRLIDLLEEVTVDGCIN